MNHVEKKKIKNRNSDMETIMTTKSSKSENKNETVLASIRVKGQTKNRIDDLVKKSNTKKLGKKILPDDLVHFALNLVTPEHIKELQAGSLRPSDRKHFLFQKYLGEHPDSTREDFEGFTMTPEWMRFLKKYEKEVSHVA